MQRARLTQTGWNDDLSYEADAGPPPQPVRDQVVVEIDACGVCYRDCVDRDGGFAFIRVPITPGHEAAGRVVAVGPDVTDWQPGDRVASLHREFCGACTQCQEGQHSLCQRAAAVLGLIVDGGYASHLVAPQRAFYAIGDDVDPIAAAVLHCTFGTAYRGLAVHGGVTAGSRVLVTGANGGVGVAAIQVARRLGADVIAVVRDPRHEPFLRALGADVIVSDDGRFHKRIGAPVDVAIECVGQPVFNAALRSVRVGGTIIAIGNVVPVRVELNLGYIITRGVRIVGSSGATREDMAAVLALHREQPLDVTIDRTLPLSRADEAQRAVRGGGLRGRVVVVPDPA